MADEETKAPALAAGTDPKDMERPADDNADVAERGDEKPPVEDTETHSDTEVGAAEPVATAKPADDPNEHESDQLKSPLAEDGTRAYDHDDAMEADDHDDTASVSVGTGTVVGDGAHVQSFVEGDASGDGVTGKTQDGATYQAAPANTGTTPLGPKPATADALIAGIASPAKVEAATKEVFDGLRADTTKAMAHGVNIFDNTGFSRADLPALATALNSKFGIAITIGEVQNFMVWQDVTNSVKRKLAVSDALAA